jgi:hypothetical protein
MASMHDHIAQTFPDLCPMHGVPGTAGIPAAGARPVPVPRTKCEDEAGAVKAAGAEVTKAAAGKPPKMACPCGARTRGKFCPGCGTAMSGAGKAAGAGPQGYPVLTADGLEAAVAKAMAPLAAGLAETRKALKDQGDLIDQMASAPDPRYAPFKAVAAGGVLPKALAAPPQPVQSAVEKAASGVQDTLLRDLQYQARNDPDPGKREVAWTALTQMLTGVAGPPRQ